MTISNRSATQTYESGGPTFTFPFNIFDESQVSVTVTTEETTIPLVRGTHYTVLKNVAEVPHSPGSITFTAADQNWKTGSSLAADYSLSILRVTTPEQRAVFKNQGGFLPQTLENVVDRIIMLIQELSQRGGSSSGDQGGGGGVIPSPADLTNLALLVTPSGTDRGQLGLYNGTERLGDLIDVPAGLTFSLTGDGDSRALNLLFGGEIGATVLLSALGVTTDDGGGVSPTGFSLSLSLEDTALNLVLTRQGATDSTTTLIDKDSEIVATIVDEKARVILKDGVVTSRKVESAAITHDKLSARIGNNDTLAAVDHDNIKEDAVRAYNIQDSNITSGKLANMAVTTEKVDDGAITEGKLNASVNTSLNRADTVGDRPEDISDSVWEQLVDQSNDDINAEDHAKLDAIIESDGRITPRAWNELDFDEVSNASGGSEETFVDTVFLDNTGEGNEIDILGTPTKFGSTSFPQPVSSNGRHQLARLFVYEKTLAREMCKYADVNVATQGIKVFYQFEQIASSTTFERYTVCEKRTHSENSGTSTTAYRLNRVIFLDNRLYSDPDFFDVPGFAREFQYEPTSDSLVEVHGSNGTLRNSLQVSFELSQKYKFSGALIENGTIPGGKLGTDSVISSNVESLAGSKIVEGTVTSRELSPDVDRKLDQTTTNRRNIFGDNFGFYDPNGESGVDNGHYPARSAELLGGLGAKFGSGTVTINGREGAIEFHEDGTSSNLNPDICVFVEGAAAVTLPANITTQPFGDDVAKVYRRLAEGQVQYDFGAGEVTSRRILFTSAPATPLNSPKLTPMSAVDVARGFEHINFLDVSGSTISAFTVVRREQAPAFPGVAGDRYLELALDTNIEVNSWLRGDSSWSRSSVIATGRSVGIGARPPTRFSDPDAPLSIPGILNTLGAAGTFYLLAGDGIVTTSIFLNIRIPNIGGQFSYTSSGNYAPFSFRVVDTHNGNVIVKAAIVVRVDPIGVQNAIPYLVLEDTAGNIQQDQIFSGIKISKDVNGDGTLIEEERYNFNPSTFNNDITVSRSNDSNLGSGQTSTSAFRFGPVSGENKSFKLNDLEGYRIEFIDNNRRYRGVSLNESQPEINSSEFNFWIETDNDDNLVDFWNWDQVWKKLDDDDFDDLERRVTHTEDVLGIGERDHRYPLGTHFEPRSPLEGKVGGGDDKYWITRDGAIYAYGDQANSLGSFTAPGDYTSPRYHQLVEFEQNSKTYLATVVAEAIGRGNSRARLQIVEIANGAIAARQEASNFNYSAVTDTTSENFIINHKPILGLTKTGDTEFTIAYVKQETDGRANAVHFARYAYSSTNPDSFNFGLTRFTEEDSPFVVSAERTFEAMSQTLDGTKLYVLWWELGVGFIIRSYTTAIVSEFFTISDEAVAAAVDETTVSSGRRGTGRGLKVTADVGVIQELVVATTSALTIYAQDSIFHRIDNIEDRLEEDNVMLLGSGTFDVSTANVFLSDANTPTLILPTTGELKISLGEDKVVSSIPIQDFATLTPADYGDASNTSGVSLRANFVVGPNITPLALGITSSRQLLIGAFTGSTTTVALRFYHVGGVGGGPAVAGESSGGLTEEQATNLIATFARAQSPSGTIPNARLPDTATRTDIAIETLATEEMAELLRSFCYKATTDEDELAALVSLGLVKSDATGITSGVVINNTVSLSQADYDAIATKDANTLYLTPVT